MLNEKMIKLGANRSVIRELFEYGRKRKEEIGEENVFDFSLGNPSVPAPPEVNASLRKLLESEDSVRLHGYTSAAGDSRVRDAVAKHLNSQYATHYDADCFYMTVGAAAALTSALTAVVCPGEEVILLAPYFPEYRVFIERIGAVVREVACDSESFQPDADAIRAVINEKTAAIIVNSPNNPTGVVYTEDSLAKVSDSLRSAEKELGKTIYLISDEPYRELVYADATVPHIPLFYKDTIVCYSYSKSLSIPGERIGYCLASPDMANFKSVIAAIAGAARALGYVCAPAMLQKMLPYCLGKTSDIAVYDENRRLLLEALTAYGFSVVKPDGAFYLFVKAPNGDAADFSEKAKRHELLVVPSDSFGVSGYVRIAYCVTTEQIRRALPAFRALAKEIGL